MEMEQFHINNDGSSIEEPSSEQLINPSSPEIRGISGDPEVNPRVGSQYQAEIPHMISEFERSRLLQNPYDSEDIVDGSHSFLTGLPFPVSWIPKTKNREDRMNNPENAFNANGLRKSRTGVKNNILKKKGSKQNAEQLDQGLSDEQESNQANLGPKVAVKANLSPQKCKNYNLVPGSFNHPWSDVEVNSFILGLYIFGKNFFQIKRFMDNIEMGDILSFYYGDFYVSHGYRRWSDCHKKKRKKCIYGERLFTGWRREELLSRLHPHVLEDSQTIFVEVSTAFSEGKISLEDYISKLKAVVGIQVLVDAVGIGKGKEDLTSLAMESGKKNPLFTACLTGKACSSLTSSDIIKLLTGGFRLSKARCNDIFWEAVWPRLLARGWHSEQPKNQIYMGPNHFLVFLVPGVKKFSKRKLVKGNHYFDSISDVLSKVASEPNLIELETEEAGDNSCNKEYSWIADVASVQDDLSNQQSHRYLKPRVSNCNLKLVSFTIVDSGLADGGRMIKMRKMRYAPDDLKAQSLLTTLSSNIEMFFSENSLNDNELEVADNIMDCPKNIGEEETLNGSGSDHTKFTIVDTSLINGGKSSEVRQLRYSPVAIRANSEMSHPSMKNEENLSKDSLDWKAPMETNKLHNGEKDASKCNHSKEIIGSSSSEKKGVNRDIRIPLTESIQDKSNTSTGIHATRIIKHKFSRRPKTDNSNNLVPSVKRQRLASCTNTEMSRAVENYSVGLGSKQEGPCCALNSVVEGSSMFQVSTPEKSSLTTSVEEDTAGRVSTETFGTESSHGKNVKHQIPCLIDLNLPQIPLHSENDEPALMDVESSKGTNVKLSGFQSNSDRPDSEALRTSVDASTVAAADSPQKNPRRQSTRKRPLSAKALEALECGLLGSEKRQKCLEVQTQELLFSSSFCWPYNKVKLTSNHGKVSLSTGEAKEGKTSTTTPDRTEEKCPTS